MRVCGAPWARISAGLTLADRHTDIQQRADEHASLLEEIGELKATASRVDRLENQNRALVQELDRLRTAHVADPPLSSLVIPTEHPVSTARPALTELSTNGKIGSSSVDPSSCDIEKQTNWEKMYTKVAMRYTALENMYEERKRAVIQYRDSRDSWTKYAQSLEAKVKKLEKRLQRGENANGQPPRPPLSADKTRPTKAVEETEDESEGVDELPSLHLGMATEPMITVKQEPSSDAPVVVSERMIRKRKHPEEDGEISGSARRIKSEQSASSDPVITSEAPTFRAHESIDLDDEEPGMPTPKKQRPLEHAHLREEDVVPPAENESPRAPRFVGAYSGRSALKSDTPSRGPLASDSFTPKLSRTHRDRRSPIKAGWTMKSGIADVAEETVESFYSPTPRGPGKGPAHQTLAPSRLHSLLNQGSPDKTKTASFLPQTRLGRNSPNAQADKENMESMPPQGNLRSRKNAQDKPKGGRLRDRPLAQLRPEDFKVNPKSNNGHSYAFDEVVRNKGERAELAGCTDPNCCGREFRAMAESELSAGGPGVLSRMADTKMMEDYLGHESHRLVEMTREERKETWLKAKIQDLANRYGKHRHRFARRPSPPGYWNPDFPSTQEIAERKEEAERRERGVVEDRWREAMRGGGGRWLFRDE